jgi:hypothetical protein
MALVQRCVSFILGDDVYTLMIEKLHKDDASKLVDCQIRRMRNLKRLFEVKEASISMALSDHGV